jgi:lipoprotein-releasing system permease protein
LEKIGGRVGGSIQLATGGQAPRPFKVVGTFRLGVQQLDDAFIYAALRDVQQLNGTPGRISQIAIRLLDVADARARAEVWARGSLDKVQSWDQANANFLQIFKIQDIFRIFITFGILLVAAFGIYNVLSIIVNQKKREIAILRALGYPPRDILNLFLIQGSILGGLGGIVGLIFGFGICYFLTTLEFDFGSRRGLTVSFDPSIYVQGFFMSFIASIIASVIPAREASRMTPIDIIRQEG